MIVVRDCFVAKPGQARKLAAQFKEAAAAAKMDNFRVLHDVTGAFNQVVLEFEVESLAEYEAKMKESAGNTAFREKMAGYTELWLTGKREILQFA